MKKKTFILAGSLLVLALSSCSSKEGKEGLLSLKDKQAYEFDQMYRQFNISCTQRYLEMRNETFNNMGQKCKSAYADLENKIKDKFSVSNVTPINIQDAYPSIQQEANSYANSHADEILGASSKESDQANKDFFNAK